MKNQVFDAIRKRKELVAAFLAVVMALFIAADALTGAFGIVRAESVPAVPLAGLEDIQRACWTIPAWTLTWPGGIFWRPTWTWRA